MVVESTYIAITTGTYKQTYKFGKKIWNMYFNVCALKTSIYDLQGSWSFGGVM